MRVVYMGSPEPAVLPLKYLLERNTHNVVAVVSQQAKAKGRGKKVQDPAVARFAKEHGLYVLQPVKARDPEFLSELRELSPDVVVTCAYGQILTEAFLQIPKRATINIHPSLLPKYRGAIPVNAALLDGETETGVTVLFTVKALDAGNVIVQKRYPILEHETADVLLTRLLGESGALLEQALEKLEDPNFHGKPQDESAVTHCKKVSKEDGRVDWNTATASEVERQFRGLFPWPGAYTFLKGKRVVLESVHRVSAAECSNDQPGAFEFDRVSKSLVVRCATGHVAVKKLKPEGKKSVSAQDFANGHGHAARFERGEDRNA